jgi:spermidine/putrescine transport system ATP-binding protein
MVRPEAIRVLAENETVDFSTTGTLADQYLLGSRTQYEIVQDGGRTIVVEAANQAHGTDPGESLRLGFDLPMAHLIREARP